MNKDLFVMTERKANLFNIKCLIVIIALGIATLVLNELNFFTVNKNAVIFSMIPAITFAFTPIMIYLIHDKILKKDNSILELPYFKAIVLVFCFLCVMILCVILSFHTTLLLVIPTLLAAQYKNNKIMALVSLIASLVSVLIVVYASLLFGIYDANLMKPLTLDEAASFKNRLNLLTRKRIFEILLHYVTPRLISVAAIDFIALSINKRNDEMLDIQLSLTQKVQEESDARAKMHNGLIEHLADIIESRDIETGEHIKRTKNYVTILVNKMKEMDQYKDYLDDKMCDNIISAAPLHDIGKIAVSDLILRKPGKLTDDEFAKMKIHTTKGGEIINNILNELGDEDFLKVAYDIATSHHEKWNGSGYPNGLKGEDIPLAGRIMAIADVFDALVAERVYKKPIPVEDAINIIINDSGTHFDPNIVEVFKEVKDDFIKEANSKCRQ